MIKIIIVEDNDSIRESVSGYLKLENYTVYEFNRCIGVYEALEHKDIDLVILDIMLPDGDGFNLAKKIKLKFDIPIIFLTARINESDRITGFELGADDYIVKPFSPKELVLRIKTVLKRINKSEVNNISIKKFSLKNSILEINNDKHKILLDGIEIYLTKAEWELLNHLSMNTGLVISRNKLLGECLDYISEGSERTIDTHIKSIRKKINNPEWIETVRSYGYKFTGEIV